MTKDKGGDGQRPPKEKKYQGARGPRSTPPRKRKSTHATVTKLFGEETAAEYEERRPKGQESDFHGGNRLPEDEPRTKRVQKRRAKVRMGERWTRVMDQLEAEGMTMAEFVKQLTPEELARGQLKNDRGSFVGAPPKWVPSEFHKACIRELMNRGKVLYQESYIEAIQSMTQIANSPSVDPAQRIRAAQFVIERIEGKVPDKLEVGLSEPWQELMVGIVADATPGAEMRPFSSLDGLGE